jgi:hypothetical protein
VFFDVISARYETWSMICSSNKGFSEWGSLMGDTVLATAILDRLRYHYTDVTIKGQCYCLKDRRKQEQTANLEVAGALKRGDNTQGHEVTFDSLQLLSGGSVFSADPGSSLARCLPSNTCSAKAMARPR